VAFISFRWAKLCIFKQALGSRRRQVKRGVMRLRKSVAITENDQKGGMEMIVRLWHGRTNISKADEYAEFMKERAAPDYGSIDGLKKLYFLRRIDEEAAHFLLVTLWDSMESVKKFAGEHPELAKYYPEDDSCLLEKEATSDLYEVFFEK
jgi:heme-degrading monooxygenase HmoA